METRKTIAVLPFVNRSPNPEQEYFCDGMTEEIIQALSRIPELRVTSRTSSFYFKDKSLPLPEIGRQLKVATILEGSLQTAGQRLRLSVRLVNVEEDVAFWSERFDRSLDDLFAVQDEVSMRIADHLREQLGHFDIGDRLVDAPQVSVTDYQTYLKGKYFLSQLGPLDVLKGIEILKPLTESAPDFALAQLGVNQGYAYLGAVGYLPRMEAFAKGQAYLERALKLAPQLPESLVNQAWISCWQHWDLKSTYEYLNQALEIRPADHIYLTMANTLGLEERFAASLNYVDKALEMDPFDPVNHHYKGCLFYLQEKYDAATPWFESSLKLKPDLGFPKLYGGFNLLLQGKVEEALRHYEALDDSDGSLDRLGGLTLARALKGGMEMAEQGIAHLKAALEEDVSGHALHLLILVHAQLGLEEETLALLEKGLARRVPIMLLLRTEPLLKSFRSHPRFQAIMAEVFGTGSHGGPEVRKYKKALLPDSEIESYRETLEQLMASERPYLDPQLSLRKLADQLALPPNYLSQLLNEGLGTNFAGYVNGYRLQDFCTKVGNPDYQHLTLLALAFESGFNSKTVFNTYFKKQMGKTPRQYWKEVVGA